MQIDTIKDGIMYSTVFEDNNGALGLALAPKLTPRTKHIAVKYHFFKSHVGDMTSDKPVRLMKIDSEKQKADIFTKGLPMDTFETIRGEFRVWMRSAFLIG